MALPLMSGVRDGPMSVFDRMDSLRVRTGEPNLAPEGDATVESAAW